MTWKEFKEKVEAAGVKDKMEIEWIDIMMSDGNVEVAFPDTNLFTVLGRYYAP